MRLECSGQAGIGAAGNETREVEVVESWRNLQGTATSFEAGFHSKSNDYEKRKWPDPSGVRRLD